MLLMMTMNCCADASKLQAAATLDGNGAITQIRVIKAGPVFTDEDAAENNINVPGNTGSDSRIVLDASGQLSSVDFTTGTANFFGAPPTPTGVLWNNNGDAFRSFLGAGWAEDVLQVPEYSSWVTQPYPATQYGRSQKVGRSVGPSVSLRASLCLLPAAL